MGQRIVVDTNIVISALGWEGHSRELLRHIISKRFTWLTSEDQIQEIKRVLHYPKFKLSVELKNSVLDLINTIAMMVTTKSRLTIIQEDPSDNRILECALDGGADSIIKNCQGLKPHTLV